MASCLAKVNSFHKYFSKILTQSVGNSLYKIELLQINYFETLLSCDALDLLIFVSYWDSHTFSQRPFLKMFTSQTTIAYCFLLSFFFARVDHVHTQHYCECCLPEPFFDLYEWLCAASYFYIWAYLRNEYFYRDKTYFTWKDLQTRHSLLNLKIIWKMLVNFNFDHVTLMRKLGPLSSKLVL